VNKSQKPMMH